MVLESLISPIKAETRPKMMILYGFLYAGLGFLLSIWIFRQYASLVMVFLTTMAATPLIYNIIKLEEKKDLAETTEKKLLKEHSRALVVFMSYFIGATFGFAFCYTVLQTVFPSSIPQDAFKVQIDTIYNIRSGVTGNASQSFRIFSNILANNLKVLIFCILFSFLYGLGALFILTWNASVIGVAIGDTIRTGLFQVGEGVNLGHITVISYGLFRYSLHGIPEILAYFIAALAGGIISIAAIRHDFGTKKYVNIIMDSSVLLLLSIVVLIIAAVLEVYVTPVFF
jgi:uncharacterized membrane protein SpoIIM required for sporulation